MILFRHFFFLPPFQPLDMDFLVSLFMCSTLDGPTSPIRIHCVFHYARTHVTLARAHTHTHNRRCMNRRILYTYLHKSTKAKLRMMISNIEMVAATATALVNTRICMAVGVGIAGIHRKITTHAYLQTLTQDTHRSKTKIRRRWHLNALHTMRAHSRRKMCEEKASHASAAAPTGRYKWIGQFTMWCRIAGSQIAFYVYTSQNAIRPRQTCMHLHEY